MATNIGPDMNFFDSSDLKSFIYQIQRGAVQGYTYMQMHMYSSELSGTYYSTVWSANTPSLYRFLSASQTLQISSTDVNDTAAGTGGRTVFISGLNSNYDVVTEVITLNGKTPVTTVNSYFRINSMKVQDTGSDLRNRGDIFLGSGVVDANGNNSNPQSYITPGGMLAVVGIFTVPRGYAFIMFDFQMSASAIKEPTSRIRTRPNATAPFNYVGGRNLFEKNTESFEVTTLTLYEKADLEVLGRGIGPNTKMGADIQSAIVDVKFLN